MDSSPEVSWLRLASFVRQLSHDMRNHLNGLDLEAALLTELATDGEAKACIARLRRQIRGVATEMRALSAKFAPAPASLSEVVARDLFVIWRDQASAMDSAPAIEWYEDVDDVCVKVDVDALARVFRELLVNAVAFGAGEPLRAEANKKGGDVLFKLIEPKAVPVDYSTWGSTPLVSTRRGGYGLGLWVVQHDVSASGGLVERHYDAAARTLTTTLAFPAL